MLKILLLHNRKDIDHPQGTDREKEARREGNKRPVICGYDEY
jgi:hypothetical protein